jgi:predicted ATPase
MELSVEGYKSIASKQTLTFDGLTVLSGANSSGKSSFMQPFLILKQTIENHYDSGALELYGENAKLTDSSQVISKVPLHTKKSFSVEMKTDKMFCNAVYKYKRGYGLQVDSVKFANEETPKGLTLKLGMKSELIDNSVSEKRE